MCEKVLSFIGGMYPFLKKLSESQLASIYLIVSLVFIIFLFNIDEIFHNNEALIFSSTLLAWLILQLPVISLYTLRRSPQSSDIFNYDRKNFLCIIYPIIILLFSMFLWSL